MYILEYKVNMTSLAFIEFKVRTRAEHKALNTGRCRYLWEPRAET